MVKKQQDHKDLKSRSFGPGRDALHRDEKVIHDPRGSRKDLADEPDSPIKPRHLSANSDPNEKTPGYASEGQE